MPVDPQAAARISERIQAAGLEPADPLIVVHVSAGNPFRRWPQRSFAEMIATLLSRRVDARVIVVSGPSEHDAAARVVEGAQAQLAHAHRGRVLSLGDCSLAELRALVDRAALFIGGDSGPLHIASTTATPIVVSMDRRCPRSAPWRSRLCTTESVDGGGFESRPATSAPARREFAPRGSRPPPWSRRRYLPRPSKDAVLDTSAAPHVGDGLETVRINEA